MKNRIFGLISIVLFSSLSAHGAIMQDASCALKCTVGTQEEGGDQGYPSYRNITKDVYIDFENMSRENIEKKQSNYRALNSLCKSKFGNQAMAGAMDCRYFKH